MVMNPSPKLAANSNRPASNTMFPLQVLLSAPTTQARIWPSASGATALGPQILGAPSDWASRGKYEPFGFRFSCCSLPACHYVSSTYEYEAKPSPPPPPVVLTNADCDFWIQQAISVPGT